MRGLGARRLAVGMALFSALALVSLSPALAGASSRVDGHSTVVGSLKVQVYSQMCDGGGPNLHTRLAVRNTSSSSSESLAVHDTYSRVVFDPPGPIAPGKGTLIHLTSSSRTPAHTLTIIAAGQTKTLDIPASPCPVDPPTTKPTTSTTKPTTSTTKPTTQTTGSVTPGGPGDPGDPGTPGNPVVGPGVVAVGASVGSNGTSAVKAASGTLPFTGSDIRTYALLGNLLVLIGFAMLILSHRSPRASAFFSRLRPGTAA